MDLTSLSDNEQPHEIQELCERGATIYGPVAAVCVYAKHLGQPWFSLPDQRIIIATVVNFPGGGTDRGRVRDETAAAVAAGADEIDVVLPYRDFANVKPVLQACRDACDGKLMKVILETGELEYLSQVGDLSRLAVDCGADFLKTSTGKSATSATLEATGEMLGVIAKAGRPVGLKPSGGIKTLAQAQPFIEQAAEVLGALEPANFRLGASSLLNDVLSQLRVNEGA